MSSTCSFIDVKCLISVPKKIYHHFIQNDNDLKSVIKNTFKVNRFVREAVKSLVAMKRDYS